MKRSGCRCHRVESPLMRSESSRPTTEAHCAGSSPACPSRRTKHLAERRCEVGFDYEKYITIEPGKRSGKPCIRGLRITVSDILDYLASGMTEDEILQD